MHIQMTMAHVGSGLPINNGMAYDGVQLSLAH